MKNFVSTGLKNCAFLILFLFLFMLTASPAAALTITDSSSFNVNLNDGAFITSNNAASNTFNNNDLINMNDGTVTNDGSSNQVSAPFPLSVIPYTMFGGINYFMFIYDMQETGNAVSVSIDDIVLKAGVAYPPAPASGGTVVWDYNDSILLNSEEPYSDSPRGAGGDMALYVPVNLFEGLGLTGSSLLTMTVTQSLSNNGDDEWVVLNSAYGDNFFGPNDPITDPPTNPIPEPASMLLMGAGLMTWGVIHRRRRKAKR